MARQHRNMALLAFAFCALGPFARADEGFHAHWSIVDANGAAASFGDGRLIEICPLEELRIRVDAVLDSATIHSHDAWERSTDTEDTATVCMPLDVVRTDDADRVVAVLAVNLKVWDAHDVDVPPENPPVTRAIECALDAAFCVPKIVGIRLPDVNSDDGKTLSLNHSIVLQFASPTNRPNASTREAIESFVSFPTYVGDALNGSWFDDKTLVIVVTALEESRVLPLQQLMATLVHTTVRFPEVRAPPPRTSTARIQGDVRLRVEPLGDYAIRLPVGDTLLKSPIVRLRDCEDSGLESPPLVVILRESTRQAATDAETVVELPEPAVFIDGVLSHSGAETFEVRHSAIQIQDPGSWSLNFWLFTDQDPTGKFRGLFFNGDGTGQHRTPSAWFRPDDRRLVLRVSTAANMDVGMDSKRELPRNEWVNIGVTFTNCSTGVDANSTAKPQCKETDDAAPWLYEMALFVNGELDQQVRMSTPVLPNDGPLQLAKSPWSDGFRGFTSQVRVYGSSIRWADHKAIYTRGRSLHQSFDGSQACDGVVDPSSDAKSPVYPVQRQISYWTQCLALSDDRSYDQRALATQRTIGETTAFSLYEEALRLRSLCDHSSWDLLVESADLEDPRAQCDVGTALVYGRFAFAEGDCVKSKLDGVLMDIDHDRAKRLLLEALRKREWRAARSLALFHTYNHSVFHPLQAGLYHLAAATGRKDTFMVLGRLYSDSSKNKDVAAYHYAHAASEASIAYHARGRQPLHEMDRLYDGLDKEDDLKKGQLGDDDALIQYQKMRADKEGDVEAMANMGDLYYWGARGLTRDHEQAYNYYHRAAQQGHTSAKSAVAGMLLKGEGTKQDNTSAVAWYEKAALQNHTRALNGLGFLHFYGSGGMDENKTRALELFERAAANMEDGDSVFNAGYCHALGLGTARNLTRAMAYYDVAARKFGHFDAIYELGKLYWSGWEEDDASVVARDSGKAIPYLRAASEAGAWGASVRTGFEFFLGGQYERASVVYAEASEYGYKVATSNLAYVYDQKLRRRGDVASEQRALHHLQRASERNHDKETLVRIGDFYYYAMAGVPKSAVEALRWYSRASAEGVDAGAYNVGHMHEYGLGGVPTNYERAERYYRRLLELAPPDAIEKRVVAHLALVRVRIRRWWEGVYTDPRQIHDHSVAPQDVPLPMLPGDQGDARRWMVTGTSIVMAFVVASVGAWIVRRRH